MVRLRENKSITRRFPESTPDGGQRAGRFYT